VEKSSQPRGKTIAFLVQPEEGDEKKSGPMLGILQLPDGGSDGMPGMGISSRPALLDGQRNLLQGQGEENMGSEAEVLQKMRDVSVLLGGLMEGGKSAEVYIKRGQKPRGGQMGKGSRRVMVIMLLGIGLFLGGGISDAQSPQEITYPTSDYKDGKARFYEFKAGKGVTIKYFILKSSDGVIRAAFDACDVCWPEGKGYQQKGDTMVCRNCGRRFASTKINVITGGCNPGALQRQVVGDRLVIKVKDILEGKKYFNFPKRG